jgi:hypothetical protein
VPHRVVENGVLSSFIKRSAAFLSCAAAPGVREKLRTKRLLTVAASDNVMRVLIEKEDVREFVDALSAAAAEFEVPAAGA